MIGDTLAKGALSAQFAGASSNITDFENDMIYMGVSEVLEKYGLSQAEYDTYCYSRGNGDKLPDLTPVALQEKLEVGFSISDHRKNYMLEPTEAAAVKTEAPKKYPEPTYEQAHPILDRVLVMIVADDPDTELLEDGSTRNKKSGLITAAKYRQHSNVGVVLAAGQHVVLSGMRFDLSEFVEVGDKITYGDYNSEVFPMDKKKIEALCDNIQVNYVEDPKGLRVVRVQDIRVVEKKVKSYNQGVTAVTMLAPYSGLSTPLPLLECNGTVRNV
jgi:co-chaperonin GroES (HSP10)